MMTLRDAMRKEAGRIWREKARAESLGLFMNEETITETLLLNLAKRFQGKTVRVRPFTKAEETKNGADWEFWFMEGQQAVGLRIQAKRLYPSGRYDALYPKRAQTKALMSKSGDCFPVFIFYNDSQSYDFIEPNCCCRNWRGRSHLGCTAASAYTVARRNNKDAAKLAPYTIPWHCLLCPKRSSHGASLPEVVSSCLNALLQHDQRKDEPRYIPRKIIDIPEILRALSGQIGPVAREGSDEEPPTLASYLKDRSLAGVALLEVKETA
jgi:hypothetical protein